LFFCLALAMPLHAAPKTRVTLLQFSDYHSHALPFYSEDRRDQGGIARALGYLRREKERGALVFSGGDMVNKGAPAWSDKYQCAEWPWLNGIVDAMAFGNHDPDYGREAFDACRKNLAYPILSANAGGFQGTLMLRRGAIRIGVFALAGPDFAALVKAPFTYRDRVEAAREAVRTLREAHADAVVMIGHEHESDDFALARAVPGIDVLFGSHSHLKREMQKIEGTETWYLAPYQYLTYICRVELTFDGHHLAAVRGRLVAVDASLPEEKLIAARVAAMQRDLEHDPQYAPLFVPFAILRAPLPLAALGRKTVEVMRDAARADAAASTASSFRQPLPRGAITLELLRNALPYDNEIVVVEMRGDALRKLVERGGGEAEPLFVAAPLAIDPQRGYRVAATDYLAGVDPAYRDVFAGAAVQRTGLRAREELRKWLAAQQP
jgi:5'-nucleotidase/UDP-sugar diphosphatase